MEGADTPACGPKLRADDLRAESLLPYPRNHCDILLSSLFE